jgi:hypothetical protein
MLQNVNRTMNGKKRIPAKSTKKKEKKKMSLLNFIKSFPL